MNKKVKNLDLTFDPTWGTVSRSARPINPGTGEPWPCHRFTQEDAKTNDAEKLRIISADTGPIAPHAWLIEDWIEVGELTIIAGPPNSGKTALCCALAAAISTGLGLELTPKRSLQVDEERGS